MGGKKGGTKSQPSCVQGGEGSSGSLESKCHIELKFIDNSQEMVLLMFTGLSPLNKTLGRISDFVESKKFKGQYLPLAQWRAMPRPSGMVYQGHNFPGSVFLRWLNLVPQNDFAEEEKQLLAELGSRKLIKCTKGKWEGKVKYVIAATYGDSETVRHEVMPAKMTAALKHTRTATKHNNVADARPIFH